MEKDIKYNVVFVSRNYYSVDKRRRLFRVGSLRWFNGSPSRQIPQFRCKVQCSVSFLNSFICIMFSVPFIEHQRSITSVSMFYEHDCFIRINRDRAEL